LKAIFHDRFGLPSEVLSLRDIDKPIVGDDEVLIKVHAASTNPYDWHFVTGTPFITRLGAGTRKPKFNVPGVDLAGTIEAVGSDVRWLMPGDEVFGRAQGAFAEYASTQAGKLVGKPANITFEEAAAARMAAMTALQAVRDKGKVNAGQKVLINGASGGVGTFAVQIAKSLGAEVTGVCSSRNVEMVRSIGADHVIDYTEQNFTEDGPVYDVLIDNIGNHSLSDFRRSLTSQGTYVLVGGAKQGRLIGPMKQLFRAVAVSPFVGQNLSPLMVKVSRDDLLVIAEMLTDGTVKSVIDRTFDLADTPEALTYQGEGHAQGKIIITIP